LENVLPLAKCITLGKMPHTWKNAQRFKKLRHTCKSVPHLEKCSTLGKLRKSLKNAPRLTNCATLAKMCHAWKNAARLVKLDNLEKMRHL